MRVKVKVFAGLREQLGFSEKEIDVGPGATVGDVWCAAAGERAMPGNVLTALNMDYVKRDAPVSEGDEVAYFPPVTRG